MEIINDILIQAIIKFRIGFKKGELIMFHILVVEDDIDLNRLISHSLEIEGFKTKSVTDGAEALLLIKAQQYDLILLDIMIPNLNGIELLQKIRVQANTPVCIISSKTQDADKVLGLGLGADDYVTKPFSMIELIARVRALLRRSFIDKESKSKDLSFDDLTLKEETHEFFIKGRPVPLTKTEFEVMKLFISNPYKVFSKSKIFRIVWKGEYLSDDNNVMVMIRRLRIKIEDNPSDPKYIKTIWGIGYKLGDDEN